MRYGHARTACWLGLVLAAGLNPPAAAQPTVRLRAPEQPVFVSEAFLVEVEVANFVQADAPDAPPIRNASIRPTGVPADSSYIQIVNGRRFESRTRTYSYEITPAEVGTLIIPPFVVEVDGAFLRTQEHRIEVQPSDADELFQVEIAAGRSRAYVGQRLHLTMTIWVKPPTIGRQRLDPSYVLRRIDPIEFGPFPREIANAQNVGRAREIDGRHELYYAFDFVTQIVPEHAGMLDLSSIRVGLTYPMGSYNRNLRAQPNVPPIEILPVPMQGRPASYVGAVGLFDITTSAEPTDVRVGDPITLRIAIAGDGPLETLPPPVLSLNVRLARDFRLPGEQLAGEYRDGRRVFTLTIRPEHERVKEIPPIEYPYFDPDAERYVTARSEAIPLRVRAVSEVAVADYVAADRVQPGPAGPVRAVDGLRDVETRESRLLARTTRVTVPAVVGVAVVPPLAFGLSWLLIAAVERRHLDPVRRRRSCAQRTARGRLAAAARLSGAAQAGEVSAALVGYLTDRLAEPPAKFTGPDAADLLRQRGLPPAVIEDVAGILHTCERAVFAGETVDADHLCERASVCLSALERHT